MYKPPGWSRFWMSTREVLEYRCWKWRLQKPEGELQPAFMTGTRTGLLPMLPGALGHAGAATGLKYWGRGSEGEGDHDQHGGWEE